VESNVAILVATVTAGATLAGVTLSWLLAAISNWFKERRAEKRELGLLVAELFRIHHEMGEMKDRILRNTGRPGGQPKPDIMTTLSMKASAKYILGYDKMAAAIEQTKKHIAARNPVAATRLDAVQDLLWQVKDGSRTLFDDQAKTDLLATVVIGFDAQEPELARLVLALAWMHSPITWWRVKRTWTRRVRDTGGWVKETPKKEAGVPDV
jgi:hypothetical protein